MKSSSPARVLFLPAERILDHGGDPNVVRVMANLLMEISAKFANLNRKNHLLTEPRLLTEPHLPNEIILLEHVLKRVLRRAALADGIDGAPGEILYGLDGRIGRHDVEQTEVADADDLDLFVHVLARVGRGIVLGDDVHAGGGAVLGDAVAVDIVRLGILEQHNGVAVVAVRAQPVSRPAELLIVAQLHRQGHDILAREPVLADLAARLDDDGIVHVERVTVGLQIQLDDLDRRVVEVDAGLAGNLPDRDAR